MVPLHVGLEPVWGHRRQDIERLAQRLAHPLQAVERAHRRQHRRGVGPLTTAGVAPAAGFALLQQHIQQALRRSPLDQPGPELAQDGVVEARITQLSAEGILPIPPAAHRSRGLPIGEPLDKLPRRDQRPPPRRLSWLSPRRKQVSKVSLGGERPQRVS